MALIATTVVTALVAIPGAVLLLDLVRPRRRAATTPPPSRDGRIRPGEGMVHRPSR